MERTKHVEPPMVMAGLTGKNCPLNVTTEEESPASGAREVICGGLDTTKRTDGLFDDKTRSRDSRTTTG
jgi:hypothetical protein